MKIHITNLYNFNSGDELVKRQHLFAKMGRMLGFYEMGVFSYPVETDTPEELSKRLDGVIASLEPEDVVFVQLPTENGYEYEQLLIRKIKAYRETKVVLLLHETTQFLDGTNAELQAKYLSLYQMADAVIAPTAREQARLKALGVSQLFFCDNIQLSAMAAAGAEMEKWQWYRDFYVKKVLIDAKESVLPYEDSLKDALDRDEIQIGFGLYDKTGDYSVWVGVAMQSVIENTNAAICFHILHDHTLNKKNKERLIQVAVKGGQRVQFHLLDKNMFQDMEEQMEHYTVGALFRIMLPEILSNLPRIIYLDADILAHRDIKELWDTDISIYCMAAVADVDVVNGLVRPVAVKREEVQAERYFNSGVLYMNLDKIRAKGNMRQAIIGYLEKTKESNLPDQDALNVVYGEETLLLDSGWNSFVRPIQDKGVRGLEKRIYHFVGTRCILYSMTDVDKLYYETTARTPWGEEECKKQLDKSLNRITDRIGQLTGLLHCCADETRKRVFYGEETFAMRNMYEMLSVREGDYRVGNVEEKTVPGNLAEVLPCLDISVLAEEKEPFVVLVLPEADHGTALSKLDKLGLVNGKDYFVIPRLLPPGLGGYM